MKATIEWDGKLYELDTNQRVIILESEGEKSAMMYMPGMPCPILIHVSGSHPVWSWNGDVFAPTFSPSIFTRMPWGEEGKEIRNHVFVKNGEIQYLSDCSHEYAGKTIDLPRLCDWPDDMQLWDEELSPVELDPEAANHLLDK